MCIILSCQHSSPYFWADKSSEKCGGLRPSKSYKEYNEREFRSNFFSKFIFCFSTCNCTCKLSYNPTP